MTKQEFQKLTEDHVLLLDGATGSNLMKAGMPRGVCTESWVLEHKDVIQSLQKAYIEAGSHIIYAPTFGGNRINLTMHGLEDQIEKSACRNRCADRGRFFHTRKNAAAKRRSLL